MENHSYSISLRVKMIRETEEFLEAHLPQPNGNEHPTPDAQAGPIDEGGTDRRDLEPAILN